MANQVLSSVENAFTKGLITESTGLNFPENAATDTDNCVYTLIGDVTRREGIDFEDNFTSVNLDKTNKAINTYKWNNVGGDGVTQIVVTQVGNVLYFYQSSNSTTSSPLSQQILVSTVNILNFVAIGGNYLNVAAKECQFADGNGYLFVFHPSLDPFYCAYSGGSITANLIVVQTRDFSGVGEANNPFNYRPSTLNSIHSYNLLNQGWGAGPPWATNSQTTTTINTGPILFTVGAGLTVTVNDNVSISTNINLSVPVSSGATAQIPAGTQIMAGVVTAYSGTSLTVNIYALYGLMSDPVAAAFMTGYGNNTGPFVGGAWTFSPLSIINVSQWQAAVHNYPSNADVWWNYKNSTGAFAPGTTYTQVSFNAGPAPKGHYIVNTFNQQRSLVSAIPTLTDISTTIRPKTGTWFQGRVWYAGVDASQVAIGNASFYTWTENIYFSQVISDTTQFGSCYQANDPTSETLFGLLPTDGGVIQIQGCGSIYKLFPLQNALLVFAANGVWYVTGSQGIGFTANDYTIVKLSSVQSISSTSFVDIQGLPIFWNEEGIYKVEPAKQGSSLLNSPLHVNPLEVTPITVGTILTFYNSIPSVSKRYARGTYNSIDYVVQWIYKSTVETDVTDRYQFDRVLNFNTVNSAFYPYTVTGTPDICGILYVVNPGGMNSPDPVVKYFTSTPTAFTFSEEKDLSYLDWKSYDSVGVNYTSYFVTGYKLHGQGQRRFQIPYIYIYSRGSPTSYKIQGQWDYAISGNSGRWSTLQQINSWNPNFGVIARRHKIRGQGLVLQLKVQSTNGMPFDIIGWSTFETQNTGV